MKGFLKKKRAAGDRNLRTVQSGQNAPVMRYYRPAEAKKPVLRVSEQDTDKKKNQSDRRGATPAAGASKLSHVASWISVLAVVAALIANVSLSSQVTVGVDDTASLYYRQADEYKKGASEILSQSISRSNKLSFRSVTYESELRDRFPELASAAAVVPLVGRQVHVKMEFVKPMLMLQTGDNRSGVIGQNGSLVYLSTQLPAALRSASLPEVTIVPQLTLEVGASLLTSSEVELIQLLLAESDGSEPYRPAVSSIQFDIQKREITVRFDSVSYFAKLTPESNAGSQIGSLIATLKQLNEAGESVSEYIDVRVDGRVFVK